MGFAQKLRNFVLTMTQDKNPEVAKRQIGGKTDTVTDSNSNFSQAKILEKKKRDKEEGHFQFQVGQLIRNTYCIKSLLGEGK